MRMMRGVTNAVLMFTLVRPIVRLSVSRWRKRARAAAPAVISGPMQELFEAALIEELSPPVVELEPLADVEPPADLEALADEVIADVTGRSVVRTLVIAGGLITVIAISAVAARTLVRRRRAARADRELVAVPVGAEAAEAIEEAEAIAASVE